MLALLVGGAAAWGHGQTEVEQRVVAMIFLSSECPISNRMAPEIERLCRKFPAEKVEFLLVYPNRSDTEELIQKHRREYRLSARHVRDGEHRLVKRTGVTMTPEAVVLDRDGQVTYRGRINDRFLSIGRARPEATRHDLEEAIRATLAGKAPRESRTRAIGCYIENE